MIISSISMKNFQCYYGEHDSNRLEFSEGLNLIIGDNGGGKSKLFDAFYWVIHNQIFQSDQRRMISTKIYKENLISDKAKHQCQLGERVSAEVSLDVTSSVGKQYRLVRIYDAKKVADREWESSPDSHLLIHEFSSAKWNLVPEKNHNSIINRVIPGHIKPYMWFQGEQVDSLMDLTDSSALAQVVNLLSDIKDYDDIIALSDNGSNKAENELKRAKNKLSRDEGKSNSLNLEMDSCLKEIAKQEATIEKCDENIETAKIRVEELISKVGDAESKAKHKSNKSALEESYRKIESQLNLKNNGFSKKIFSKHWVLKNVEPFFKKYETKFKNYSDAHSMRERLEQEVKIKLPINMPQPIHVEKMLDEEQCFVCGRSASKGTDEYEHISSLIKRKTPKNIFVNDFMNEFEDYYKNSLRYGMSIDGIDDSIKEDFKEIATLNSDLNSIGREIREIESHFDILIEEDNSENILSSYKQHCKSRDLFEQNKIRAVECLVKEKERKAELQSEIDKLVTGSIDKITTCSDLIFSQLLSLAKTTKNNVFEDIIRSLEMSSNEIFKDMTSKNNSIKGEIKFKKLRSGSYIPEIVDSEGYIINSPNDSNIVLVKLSLIMAILTARAKWSDNYTLISDAPTSKMAGNYTFGFYKALSERFTQSIVTTFDFLDDEAKSSLSGFKLGKVHQIESHYLNGNSDNRSDLSVNIKEVEL
ncbi:AAA family ATPase [Vibrio sp. TMPB1044]|uniref:AAA family ATPase n=1 Tax=Vibrio sp. TMPB1044 TaxID=3051822 RepID=UPI00255B834D|nr:AAA family ATPase [Vibrio sp. TMPB1044]MDL5029787.1 AAA family ATPase [Vibrio sp. TMPB1044]MDN5209915.1 AAA family ATPase [Vibrio sp. TMPB1044]